MPLSAAPPAPRVPFGELLRHWRQRRQQSQLQLAHAAQVSARHLSFLETGRSQPSREMVLRLCKRLDVPLRERNALLTAAGFAPAYAERPLGHPALEAARAAVERVLAAHEPAPALALDRHWNLLAANRAVAPLLGGVAPHLLEAPVNLLRLAVHPEGLAPRILNLTQWYHHVLGRLRHQQEATGDATLAGLLGELEAIAAAHVARPGEEAVEEEGLAGIAVPLRLRVGDVTLTLLTTTTVFGLPMDVTLSELAIETLLPADAATAEALARLLPPRRGAPHG
jgi:transcriptional regulator with XRE-family HTH domain